MYGPLPYKKTLIYDCSQQNAISPLTKESTDRKGRGSEGRAVEKPEEREYMDYISVHLTRPPTQRDYHTHTHTQAIPPRIPLIPIISTWRAG